MWEKTKKWIKDFGGWVVACVLFIVTLGKFTRDRINDRLAVGRDNAEREREINKQSERVERTIEVGEEFIEECREHIKSAEDTVERLQDRSVTVEQASEEIRRRLAQKEDNR